MTAVAEAPDNSDDAFCEAPIPRPLQGRAVSGSTLLSGQFCAHISGQKLCAIVL